MHLQSTWEAWQNPENIWGIVNRTGILLVSVIIVLNQRWIGATIFGGVKASKASCFWYGKHVSSDTPYTCKTEYLVNHCKLRSNAHFFLNQLQYLNQTLITHHIHQQEAARPVESIKILSCTVHDWQHNWLSFSTIIHVGKKRCLSMDFTNSI